MLKDLATQKDEMETSQTQLASCLSFVRESLRTGSQGEVMKVKKAVVKQIKEITESIKPEKLSPCESPNIAFLVSPEMAQNCKQFGEVCKVNISAENSYATGKGLQIHAATSGEEAIVTVYICDIEGRVCSKPVKSLTCELTSDNGHDEIKGTVKVIQAGKYEVSYQPRDRGRHQLHIKVEGEHIKGSPFPVTVKLPVQKLGAPIKTITGVKEPWGVAVNQKGEILVAEHQGNCVSFFSSNGQKICSFGSYGAGNGQFNEAYGIAIDDNGDILVTDAGNNRIQKFSADGRYITSVGTQGSGELQFQYPIGIRIHPQTKRIYVADHNNHRVQILNPDLSYFGTIAHASGNGQLYRPEDIAFDSTNSVYVVDTGNNRVQVFTEDGRFVRQIGKGHLDWPTVIIIHSETEIYISEQNTHRVSVFTAQGNCVTTFGKDEPELPTGIAMDACGMIYVADYRNNCLKVF